MDHRSYFRLGRYVNEFIQFFFFGKKADLNSHQACCLLYYLWKLLVTMAFTYTFLDVIVASDLKKNIGGSTDLAKKRHGSVNVHTPIHPTLGDMLLLITMDTRPTLGTLHTRPRVSAA